MVLALPARAKVNTRLTVTGVLPDGRHELSTDFVSISLSDLLEVEAAESPSLEVIGLALPPGENLVERARAELAAASGRSLPVRFRLHKRIPPGSGLGGGSSDAATALRALARFFELDTDLEAVAGRVGADVPFLLCGGAASARGGGEVLSPRPEPGGWFALAWPGFGVSTAAVYAAYDRVGGEGQNHLRRAAEAVEPRLKGFSAHLGEDWQMTGSGSAFFKHCETQAEAQAAVERLACWTAVARPLGRWC
jgi:4-diphosphocytidyl-2-C-methyl-D-erythritol kinase